MKCKRRGLVFACSLFLSPVVAENGENPMAKVIGLLQGLTTKISYQGEMEATQYHKWFEWCDDYSKEKMHEIKTLDKRKSGLEATIEEQSGDIEVSTSKIAELAASTSGASEELRKATQLRKKEAMDFVAGDKELTDVVDTLGRAAVVLEKEMKPGASFAQLSGSTLTRVLDSLRVVTDAASTASEDTEQLLALVQQAQGGGQDTDDSGAPAAAVYSDSKSTSVIEVLDDMKEKAEAQLADLRKVEMKSRHNFELLRQELQDQIGHEDGEMSDEKAASAASGQTVAQAQGDLTMTSKELADAKTVLADTKKQCIQVAADHERSVRSRAEELKVVGDVTKTLSDSSGGATKRTFGFLQLASTFERSRRGWRPDDKTTANAVSYVKHLADKHHSSVLAQLASKLGVVVRFGMGTGAHRHLSRDVFGKVKGLITDMIARLEREAQSEKDEKEYCDRELAYNSKKDTDLTDEVDGLTAKIDKDTADAKKLAKEIKDTQVELGELTKSMMSMDAIRVDEHAEYVEAKRDLEQGLVGVQTAIGALRDYYAKDDADDSFVQEDQPKPPVQHNPNEMGSTGAATGIIGMLEVIEQDFAKNLADMDSAESEAQREYDKTSQDDKVDFAQMNQDVKYKTLEVKRLEAGLAEADGDLSIAQEQHKAVTETLTKLRDRCIAKPEPYEERARRRKAEIDGMQEALNILGGTEDDAGSFAQLRGRRGADTTPVRRHGM